MTLISSKEFATNQQKYFDLAIDKEVYVRNGDNMFMLCVANQQKESDMIFEPDEDFYRSISMNELRERVKKDIHQWYKEQSESYSIT